MTKEVNWSLAPKSATHCVQSFNGATWMKKRNVEWVRWDRGTKKWYPYQPPYTPTQRPRT